jgi:O-antigen ligase
LVNFKKEPWITRIYSLVFYATAWLLLVKTQSVTELISLLAVHGILVLGLLYLKWGDRLKPAHGWIIGAIFLIALLPLWFGRGFWLGFFGKGSELTGRLPLWASLVPYIKQRLVFGYGFGDAFWKNAAYYQPIWTINTWNPVFAHNGYIEALMDTGIVGLVLWIIFLVQVAYFSIRIFLRQHNLQALIFFAWFTFTAVANITNNHLGSYETLTWLLLVIAFSYPLKEMLSLRHPVVPVSDPQ